MDHHCVFILNCVGLYNYKFYYQLIFFGEFSLIYNILKFIYLIILFLDKGKGFIKQHIF